MTDLQIDTELQQFINNNDINVMMDELNEVLMDNNIIERVNIRDNLKCSIDKCVKCATYKYNNNLYCWAHIRIKSKP